MRAVSGSTDSEHAFAMLLLELGDTDRALTHLELADAVERTINKITELQKANAVEKGSSMNFVVRAESARIGKKKREKSY